MDKNSKSANNFVMIIAVTAVMVTGIVVSFYKENTKGKIVYYLSDSSEIEPETTIPETTGYVMIDINSADEDELTQLSNIGPALAERIVAYRNYNGKFNNIEELMNVYGIGENLFGSIKSHIFVVDPVYPTENNEPLMVNINTADHDELVKLNTIGDVLADAIIDYRSEYGDFRNIEEIMNVPGIGKGTFERIRQYIFVENPEYPEKTEPETTSSPEEPITEPKITIDDVAPIELNTADVELLMLLPYVDEDEAFEIIELRERFGRFTNVYELAYIESFSEKELKEIIEYVFVEE